MNQISVGIREYAAAVTFYTWLGLRQFVGAPPDYARFETQTGETMSIHRVDDPQGTTIVYLEVEDVEAFVAVVDLPLVGAPTDRPWLGREAPLRDPSGNEICIYHAGENRRCAPRRIGGGPD